MSPVNEEYVALQKIQHHLNQGYDEAEVSRIWNQGNAGPCVKGVNKHNVPYDSCAYQAKVMAWLR